MARGKKSKKASLNQKSQPFIKANCSAPARNLGKGDLGAVIFGCKNYTIHECYTKKLFGLPAPHHAYVKNITRGLVLFLFNYSDRTLHGIFEAVTPGQMNIDRHAWTEDGADTPYPAQVKVCLKKHCCTLTEDQFRPIIASNYYEQSLFWFELDRSQTSKLVSLFNSLPCDADAFTLQSRPKWNPSFDPLPASDTRQGVSGISTNKEVVTDANTTVPPKTKTSVFNSSSHTDGMQRADASTSIGQKTWTSLFKSSSLSDGIPRDDASTSLEQKTWSSLFRTPSDSDGLEKDESFWTEASESYYRLDDSRKCLKSSCGLPCSNKESRESERDALNSRQFSEDVDDWETNWENPPSLPLPVSDTQGVELDASHCYDMGNSESDWENRSLVKEVSKISLNDNILTGVARNEDVSFGHVNSDTNTHHSEELNVAVGFRPHDENEDETQSSESFDFSAVVSEMILEENNEIDATRTGPPIENVFSPVADRIPSTNSFDIQSVVAMLMKEIEGLRGFQLQQHMQINYLEKELVDSKRHIALLKDRCNMLESGRFSSVVNLGDEYEWFDKSTPDTDKTILIVGGFDGTAWLADLNSYCPSRDTMGSLCPMPTRRSYASAVKLGGEVFVLGGIDGDVWYDTVESYNLISDRWVSQPSLNRKKGSLAGVNLSEKIFAIGGGNGIDCLSEVEMYDPIIGRWILMQPMQYKRFAPAASKINNALYVTGGYDGTNYLSTVERFDPREHSWVTVGNMSTKRGGHSAAVLNGKLYTLGGCDGVRMHSTVEIFDPRMNSWTLGEPMNNSRGYSGAVVAGGRLYVIGGLKEKHEILETIECYKEGYGWEVTNLNALGKRCFFSALVI
ncbi:uncharacterized protein LOC141678697 isoform X1 [Apium graveolens]|uniref:uncharacterized protein LOC141678697 isoform X1 n=1 Tax=Apium graveolens TaxID=4045 RepID=UPI003D7BBEB8